MEEPAFKLIPRLPHESIPVMNQVQYDTDWYDTACEDPNGNGSITCTGEDGEVKRTIRQKGCALVSMAMLLNYHGVETNPLDLNAFMVEKGRFAPGGSVWWDAVDLAAAAVDSVIEFRAGGSIANLRNDICRYGPQIVEVRRPGQHFVLAVGMTDDEGTVLVHDPGTQLIPQPRQLSDFTRTVGVRNYRGAQRTDSIGYKLTVSFHSPGEVLLTDPLGRRVGVDPERGNSFVEIPGAYYDTAAIATLVDDDLFIDDEEPSRQLYVPGALDGDYAVDVIGTGMGVYKLHIQRYDTEHRRDEILFADVPISHGERHQYRLRYDQSSIGSAEGPLLSGGFAGGGQRADVDAFLSYARPGERRVRVPVEISSYSLMVFYGETVDPTTFRAELNGQDISDSFHPVAGGMDVVTLSLQPGRNTLLLEIAGLARGRTSTDRDRLVFLVE